MFRQYFLLIIMLILISACSADEPITDVPFATATSGVNGTVAAPDSIGDVEIPDEFAGGEPVVLGNLGLFSFEISGEFISQQDTGTIVYNYLPNAGSLPARNQLYIAASDASASQQIAFEFAPNIEIGTYRLIEAQDFVIGGVTVSYSRLVFDGTTTRIEAFSDNIDGSLTLTSVGEVLSGEFQFTADFVETSPEGEIDIQSIEVTGRFSDVAYQISVDDPFEIEVPLPTRNFETDATEQP